MPWRWSAAAHRVKSYEAPRQSGNSRTVEMRERIAGFQINKKTVLRRAGQDLFVLLREAEKEILGRTGARSLAMPWRRSMSCS